MRDNFRALLGSLALSLGVVLFLAPNEIATGGSPGLAILLNNLTGLPVGLLMLFINVPLLLAGARILGRVFLLRSAFVMASTSFLIDFSGELLKLKPISHDPLLATIYGGVAVGVGVGLIMRSNASGGGTVVIARIVAARGRFTAGQVLLACDVFIIAASAFVFAGIEPALWSLISIYVTAKCVDMVLTGTPTEKVVHISSNKVDLLSLEISTRLSPHGSILTGTGLHKDERKSLILMTLEAGQIGQLRDIIRKSDPDAFMVVMDASELLGRGHGA